MLLRITTSLHRYLGVFALVLCVLIGGVWVLAKDATDRLLHENATNTAYWWARYVAANVADLEQIASGEQPSNASLLFFQGTKRMTKLYRYVIFNRQGYSQLVSDKNGISLVNFSEFSPQAADAMKTAEPVVGTREQSQPGEPAFFAEAYIPVIEDGRGIAVVAAYIDQSEQRDSFYRTFAEAMGWLALLTAAAFLVPTIAWYRRTREKQQADRRIRFLAHHDALTGLANRPQLFEHLERALAAMRGSKGLAAHFIDLDHFKEINDTLGHDGGDFLLKTIAERLLATVRQNDIVARLGGDEFVVIQLDVAGKEEAAQFAGRLIAALAKPMQFKDHQILPTMSVGVAVAPEDGRKSDRLLKSADLALYRSKADGRNCFRMFLPEMDSEVSARIELERIIRHAIANDGFELHYLPLLAMPGRRLIGYEALTRLRGPDGGLIPPEVFAPVAEDIKMTAAIGAWALREASKFAATWPPQLRVMIKFSPALFAAGGVARLVADALAKAGLDPPRLEVEVTETLLLGGSESVVAELRALKATGVSIVLDDFGTGHSSLGYLWRFPFDKIKIDRGFMAGLDGSGRDAETVVKTIIALARELHMRIAVEGVENSRQAAFLEHAGGGEAQGFFFGEPLAATEIAADILAKLAPADPDREDAQGQGRRSAAP